MKYLLILLTVISFAGLINGFTINRNVAIETKYALTRYPLGDMQTEVKYNEFGDPDNIYFCVNIKAYKDISEILNDDNIWVVHNNKKCLKVKISLCNDYLSECYLVYEEPGEVYLLILENGASEFPEDLIQLGTVITSKRKAYYEQFRDEKKLLNLMKDVHELKLYKQKELASCLSLENHNNNEVKALLKEIDDHFLQHRDHYVKDIESILQQEPKETTVDDEKKRILFSTIKLLQENSTKLSDKEDPRYIIALQSNLYFNANVPSFLKAFSEPLLTTLLSKVLFKKFNQHFDDVYKAVLNDQNNSSIKPKKKIYYFDSNKSEEFKCLSSTTCYEEKIKSYIVNSLFEPFEILIRYFNENK
jgi:hypothetical protein